MKGAATRGLAKLGECASARRSHSRPFLALDSRSEDSNTDGTTVPPGGLSSRAVDVFRRILHDAPANADADAVLGAAEFARRNYCAAQRDFRARSGWRPTKPPADAWQVRLFRTTRRFFPDREVQRYDILEFVESKIKGCEIVPPGVDHR